MLIFFVESLDKRVKSARKAAVAMVIGPPPWISKRTVVVGSFVLLSAMAIVVVGVIKFVCGWW
jgi:hypothetical protein